MTMTWIAPSAASTTNTAAVARIERRRALRVDRPIVVSVLPLDRSAVTSPVTAGLASLIQATSHAAVATVDADGIGQPLRALLGSDGSGDLVGLAASHSASLRRRAVEGYVDMTARVPLASCWAEGAGAIPAATLRDAVWKLRRRFPTLIIDVPHGVPAPTLAVASDVAAHVVLVGGPNDVAHEWLHSGASVISDLARNGEVTVVSVGGENAVRDQCRHGDIVPIRNSVPAYEGRGPCDGTDVYGLAEVVTRMYPEE